MGVHDLKSLLKNVCVHDDVGTRHQLHLEVFDW